MTITTETLAKKMTLVQRLLTQADDLELRGTDSGVSPEENRVAAGNYRQRAESIMREYRIEEEQLIATDASVITPIMREVVICDWSNPFKSNYLMLMYWIGNHAGVEVLTKYRNGECMAECWGYEADIRLVEMLWSSARLVFSRYLEPTYDVLLSDQVNAYNLRQAGVLRKDIALQLWGDNTPALRTRAQRLYLAECRKRGEEPALNGVATDAKTYRESYASGFVSTVSDRLRAARDAADSHGGALVFAGRAERVKEAMYTAHPHLRPVPHTDVQPTRDDKPIKPWKPTKADLRRWEREAGPAAQAGRNAGGQAALNVEIDRTTDPAQRLGA